jgi:hypothetical protein
VKRETQEVWGILVPCISKGHGIAHLGVVCMLHARAVVTAARDSIRSFSQARVLLIHSKEGSPVNGGVQMLDAVCEGFVQASLLRSRMKGRVLERPG